jgi:hypothetical protein
MSVDHGRLVPVPVLGVNRRAVKHHRVVRVVLENGRELRISAGHPTADGRTLGMLRPGDHLGGQTVVSTEVVPYEHDATYDILPASDTGTYVAGGAVIGSTLAPPVATVTSGTGLPASALVDSAAVSTPRASPEIP